MWQFVARMNSLVNQAVLQQTADQLAKPDLDVYRQAAEIAGRMVQQKTASIVRDCELKVAEANALKVAYHDALLALPDVYVPGRQVGRTFGPTPLIAAMRAFLKNRSKP